MPRKPAERVYSFGELEDAAELPAKWLADLLGISRKSLYRYRESGLTVEQADRFAMLIGLHPADVWPTWAADGLTVLDHIFIFGGGWRDDWEWKELTA